MKNSNFIKNSIIALLPISFALGVVFVDKTEKPTPVNAYDYMTLSKMDVNLNDTSSQDIRNYYSDLNDLAASEKKGTNLLENLKPILSEGQKYFSYDKGKDSIWRLYEITDRDWEKSGPTYGNNGTYDPSTNTIKGYTFGAGSSTESKNPYIHALYINRDIDNPVKAWGNHNQDGTGINQEHIWAKSHGFDSTPSGTTGGARGDPMHLWAGNGWANNVHNNFFYGYVDKDDGDITDAYTRYPATVGHNYKGKSLTLGSGTVFEPQDSDKGDIARAIFYMAARYNNYAGANQGIDGNDPNLILTNTIDNRTGTSGPNDPYGMGVLSDLLEWNRIDPPDEYEIHRNNLLYTNFTHNRNPFIDFPDWADIAFGSSTKSADPAHDTINGITEEKQVVSISITTQPDKTSYLENEYFDTTGMVVKANYDDGTSLPITGYSWSPSGKLSTSVTKVTISYNGKTADVNITVKSSVIHPNSITISPNSFELQIDSTRRLTATVLPADTTNKSVTWSSSDEDVAKVSSSGYVTAVGPGTATIRATTKDSESSVFGTATVTVPQPIVLDRIVLSGDYKTSFFKGDAYTNKGIVVTAYYKQGSVDVRSEDVTEDTEFTGFDSSKVGNCTITASYNGLTANYTVEIKEVHVEENTVNFSFQSYEFENGQTVSTVFNGDYSVSFFGPSTSAAYYDNGTSIRVYHENSFTIAGSKKIVEISFTYGSGDSRGENVYNVDKGTVDPETGHWTKADGADSVTFTLSGSTKGHRRIKEIKVVYDDTKDAEKSLLSLTIDGNPKTQYYKGDAFDRTGLIVNAHYSDFTTVDVTSSVVITGFDSSATGYKTVSISYTEDGVTKTSGYQIKINSVYLVSIGISGDYQTEFVRNETFNHTGLVVTATYTNGSTSNVTADSTFSKPDMSTTGIKEVIVTYKGYTETYEILVVPDVAEPVTVSKTIQEIATENSWANSTKHTTFDLDDVVTITASGGSNSGKYYTDLYSWRIYQSESPVVLVSVANGYKLNEVKIDYVAYNDAALLFKNEIKASEAVITTSCESLLYYVGNASTYTNGQVRITGLEVTYSVGLPTSEILEKIELSGSYKTSFYLGDAFTSDGLITTAQYNDGRRSIVTPEITGYNMYNPTTQSVSVSYSENGVTKTQYYSITVTDLLPEEITLSGTYKTSFIKGNAFTYSGLVVTCRYNSGNSVQVFDYSVSGYNKDKLGDQTITVTYKEKGKTLTKTYTINVVDATPESLEITTEPSKKSYFVGDAFSGSGIVAKCTLNNSETIDVSNKVTFSGYNMNSASKQTVTVSYTSNNKTVTDTYFITVSAIELKSIEITSEPSKTSYFVGDTFSSTGLVVKAYYNNESSKTVTQVNLTGYDMSKAEKQTVEVSYTEGLITKTDTFEIEVKAVEATSIQLSGTYKTSFFVGDEFTSEGMVVTAIYNNGTSGLVAPTSFTGYDMDSCGEQTVTVHYGDLTKTYKINVNKPELDGITLSGSYKTSYLLNEEFSADNLIVTASYNNGTTKQVSPTSITGYDTSRSGEHEVIVSYTEDGITKTSSYKITVNALTPVALSLSGNYKTVFELGDEFDSTGLVATVIYDDESTSVVSPTSITGYDMLKEGEQTVTVTYEENGKTVQNSYKISIKNEKVTLLSITLSGSYKTEFYTGDSFSSEGLVVTANYSDESTKVVAPKEISGYDLSKSGKQTVVVKYEEDGIEVSSSYEINVSQPVLTSIDVSGNYKTEFEYGTSFTSEGLIVTAHYSNGSLQIVNPSSIGGYNPTKEGYQVINVSYKENGIEKQTSYQIKVNPKEQPAPQEEKSKTGLIIGVGGGAVGVGVIILIICLAVKKH